VIGISSFDSNVLIYASGAGPAGRWRRAAEVMARGIRAGTSVLLLQALGEFSNVALRKYRLPMDDARAAVDAWRAALPLHAAAEDDLPAALDVVRDHGLQFWDAMLWATARRIGVRYLLTEDLQDGRVLHGVRFVNPFAPANDPLIDRILPA
jgi:predicted nucleic acid-binding protein